MRVLVVEDEPALGKLLRQNLERDAFAVDVATNLEDARAYLTTTRYDVILLDLGLPDGDGLGFLQSLRSAQDAVPIIAVTARDSVRSRVEGLNAGADDYLIKPFAHEELVARINAVLRRPGGALGLCLTVGAISLNTATRHVEVNGSGLVLSRREWGALQLLMRCAGRVVTRDALTDALYGYGEEPESNAIEVHVSRLRKRLKESGSDTTIQVVRGVGYLLKGSTP